jgi:hypothetical protein
LFDFICNFVDFAATMRIFPLLLLSSCSHDVSTFKSQASCNSPFQIQILQQPLPPLYHNTITSLQTKSQTASNHLCPITTVPHLCLITMSSNKSQTNLTDQPSHFQSEHIFLCLHHNHLQLSLHHIITITSLTPLLSLQFHNSQIQPPTPITQSIAAQSPIPRARARNFNHTIPSLLYSAVPISLHP